MKLYLQTTIITLLLMLQFSCKHEPKETMNAEQPPIPKVKGLSDASGMGVPIILYNKGKVEIYCIVRGASSELVKSVRTQRFQEEIEVKVFSGEKLQFEVPLRKSHAVPEWKYEGIDTIAAISDIEGNYSALVSWLKGNNIITDDFKWSFGDNHLVFNGDIMDRGDEVFQVLWLIYKLEAEAEEQGGKVHFVLGNHELLNVQGFYDKTNLGYVNSRYYKDAGILGIEYSKWLSDQTELGRWIRTKNAIVRINKELFVHGGVSQELVASGLTIQEINDADRSAMSIAGNQYDETQALVAHGYGPLWYRGLADQDLTEEEVLDILNHFGAKRVVIGHTIVQMDGIEALYNGLVIPIDQPIGELFKKGIVKGILITEEGVYELDNKRKIRPVASAEIKH